MKLTEGAAREFKSWPFGLQTITVIVWEYLVLIVAMALIAMLSGCSLISINEGSSSKKKIPAKPTVSRELGESLAQEADVARRMAGEIYSVGTSPMSRESRLMLDASDKLLTFTGKPSRAVDTFDGSALRKMHDDFEDRIERQRSIEHDWESEIMQLREDQADLESENGRLKMSFANLKFWFWFAVIGLVVVMVVFPSTIPLIVGWAKKGIAAILKVTRRQFVEVIEAVQKIREDNSIPQEVRERIDSYLTASQSSDTVEEIARLKKAHKIG